MTRDAYNKYDRRIHHCTDNKRNVWLQLIEILLKIDEFSS